MGSMSILLGCIDSRPNLVQAAISDVNELGDHDLFWLCTYANHLWTCELWVKEQVQQQIKLFSVGSMKLSRDHVCGC